MRTIKWTRESDDGVREHYTLPAMWALCDECGGEGSSSAYLGAITEEDREQNWSHDEWSDYVSGGYDKQCTVCKGEGKVLVVDERACTDKELLREYLEQLADEAEYERTCAYERRMGC